MHFMHVNMYLLLWSSYNIDNRLKSNALVHIKLGFASSNMARFAFLFRPLSLYYKIVSMKNNIITINLLKNLITGNVFYRVPVGSLKPIQIIKDI